MTKSLFKNSIYNVLYQLLNVFFPLISAAFVARILKAEAIGKVVYSQNIAQYFILLAALGIPNYGIREVAKCRDSKEKLNKVFSELFAINLISSLVCTGVYYSLLFSAPLFQDRIALFGVAGITLFLNVFNVDWFYKGNEEFKYIAARSSAVKLCSLICLIVFVRNENDYILYALINCLAVAGNYFFNIIHLKSYVRLQLLGLRIKKHLKPIVILFSTLITIELYTLLDTTMIGFLCSETEVGYYSYAMKIVNIIISIITAISGILLPRLSFYYENFDFDKYNSLVNKTLKALLTLSIPSMIGIIMVSDTLIPVLFGEAFQPSIVTLNILACRIIFIAVGNLFGTQILMTLKLEHKILISTVVGALTNIILNIILIKLIGYNGAAIASVITELCVMTVQIYLTRNYVYIMITKSFLRSITVPVISMAAAVLVIKLMKVPLAPELIISVIVGGLVYVGGGLVLKNEIILELYQRIYIFMKRKWRKLYYTVNKIQRED